MVVALLLFLAGLALVVIELFIPSMGLLAVLSGTCFIASIVFAFGVSATWGVVFLIAPIVIVPILLLVGFKVFPHTPIGRKLMLAAPDRSDAERGSDVSSETLHHLIGRTGVAVSMLRPAGVIEIDDERIDVITDGEFVEPGTKVVVAEVEGNRALVRPAEADGDAES